MPAHRQMRPPNRQGTRHGRRRIISSASTSWAFGRGVRPQRGGSFGPEGRTAATSGRRLQRDLGLRATCLSRRCRRKPSATVVAVGSCGSGEKGASHGAGGGRSRATLPGDHRSDDGRVEPGLAAARAGVGLTERALRRARRCRVRAVGLLRQPDRDPDVRRARSRRAEVLQHAHDGAVLAESLVHHHRAQPSQQRHGGHH